MRRRRRLGPIRLLAPALLAAPLALGACRAITAGAYLFGPQRIQPAEYRLSEKGRVALLIEAARPHQDDPVFTAALHDQFARILREKRSRVALVPQADVHALRRAHPDFRSWSLQRVGRELDAAEVVYLRLDELSLRERPDEPVLAPFVRLRAKVIGADRAEDEARLWPAEAEGRTLTVTRPPQASGAVDENDLALTKLARDAAHRVSEWFFDTDLESPPAREP